MEERLKREEELAQEHHLRDKDLPEECCQKEHELANVQARNNQKWLFIHDCWWLIIPEQMTFVLKSEEEVQEKTLTWANYYYKHPKDKLKFKCLTKKDDIHLKDDYIWKKWWKLTKYKKKNGLTS